MRRVDSPKGTPGVDVYSRDLGGVSMEQLSTQLRQTRQLVDSIDTQGSAARIHADAAPAPRCGMGAVAAAAGAHRAPRQPADPAAHRSAQRFRRGRLVAAAGDGSAAGRSSAGRSGARRPRVQRHGGSTRGEPRTSGAPDANGELAVAGAEDRARTEELADADPAHGRGNAGATAALGAGVHGPGGPDRGQRNRVARAPRPGVLRVRERAAGASGGARHQRRRHATAWRSCVRRTRG